MPEQKDWIDLPYAEAVRYLRSLAPTPKDIFDTMREESRRRAFTVSRIAKMEVLQDILSALTEAAETGQTLTDFVKEMEVTGLTPNHLETIYRTNLQTAFGRGSYEKLTDPQLGGAFWGFRYRTVRDERVREEHAVLDGRKFETGAHDEIYPPWSFNCRCSPEPITRREARKNGYVSDDLPAEVQQALGETDFASPALGVEYEPDLGGYDLGLVVKFINDHQEQQ